LPFFSFQTSFLVFTLYMGISQPNISNY